MVALTSLSPRHRVPLRLRQLLAAGHRYRRFMCVLLHLALVPAARPPSPPPLPAPTTTTPPSAPSIPAAATPPRKSLGQNYMLNSKVNEELVVAAGVEEGNVVLEIVPGTGSLTDALLDAGATVFAVEKVIKEDITKFHIRSHFLPFMKEKYHCTEKTCKGGCELTIQCQQSALMLSNYFSQWGMFSLSWCLCFRMKQQCALQMLQYKHRSIDLSMYL